MPGFLPMLMRTAALLGHEIRGLGTAWRVLAAALVAYVLLRFGRAKFSLWWRYHTTHSNVGMRWCYMAREERADLARGALFKLVGPCAALRQRPEARGGWRCQGPPGRSSLAAPASVSCL